MAIEFLEKEDFSIPVVRTEPSIQFLDETEDRPSYIETEVKVDGPDSLSRKEAAIKNLEEFEGSGLGKALSAPRRLILGKTLSQELTDVAKLKGKPISEQATNIVKMSVKDTARVAPFLIPGGVAGKGLSKIGKLVNVFKEAAKNAAITGSATATEELMEGEDIKKAAREGGKIASTSGALTLGVPAVGKGLKMTTKSLSKAFSRAKPWAIDEALKDPKVLTGEVGDFLDAGNKVKATLDDMSRAVKNEFNNKLNNLKVPSGKVVDTKKIKSSIKKLNIDTDILKNKLDLAAKREGVNLSDDLLNRFTTGKKIGFHEARKINSVLFDITSGKETEIIGTGLLGKLRGVKSNLLRSMEKSVPETREANKFFAENASKIQRLSKVFGKPEDKESQIKAIASQLAGTPKAKTAIINDLRTLPNYEDLSSSLIKAASQEEFARVGAPSFLKLVGSGAVGGAIGGGPGALIGAGAATALGSPEALRLGATLGRAGERIGPAAARAISRSPGTLLRRKEQ